MATVLATENISEAKAAIIAYRNTCESIFAKLQNEITALTSSDFIGDASTGYADFFAQITPALTTNLTGTSESVTSMLESLLTAVEQMLDPVDTQLGTANINAGK